jgi:NadR type nicotinamide-nucleotide adenylyltransferase
MKDFVPPCVFAAVKPKLYFIGGPSTGKSTLAHYCSEIFEGNYCAEYGRDYWFAFQKDHRLSMEDLEAIAVGHNMREDLACRSDFSVSFIDTCNLTTVAYAYYYSGHASEKLELIVRDNLWKYRHVFLCDEDIPFQDTWDRSGPNSRGRLQEINVELLGKYGIPYTVLSGSVEERAQTVKTYMEGSNLWQIY